MTLDTALIARFGQPVPHDESLVDHDFLCRQITRRSARSFTADPVPEPLLHTLLAAAMSAPSKSDLQQVAVIHIQSREKHDRIAALSPKVNWIASAPVFLVWCGDSRRIRRLSEFRQHPFANDHLDAFMNAAVDCGIAMSAFITAAESIGLACCPVSEIRDQIGPLSAELALPQWVFPVAGLCVGFPADSGTISMRLPLDVTVHTDSYDDTDLIAQVTAYDRRREAAEPTPPDAQRHADLYGVSAEYGWSENRTRQYSLPARPDFGAYIRAQGFNLD